MISVGRDKRDKRQFLKFYVLLLIDRHTQVH